MGLRVRACLIILVATTLAECHGWRFVSLDRPFNPLPTLHSWRPMTGNQWLRRTPFSTFPGVFNSLLDDSSFWSDFMDIIPPQIDQEDNDQPDCMAKQTQSTEIENDHEKDTWEHRRLQAWNAEHEKRKAAFDDREQLAKEQYRSQINAEKQRRQRLEDYHRQKRAIEEKQRQELENIRRRQIEEARQQELEEQRKMDLKREERRRRELIEEQKKNELFKERQRQQLLQERQRQERAEKERQQILAQKMKRESDAKQAEQRRQNSNQRNPDQSMQNEPLKLKRQNAVESETVLITSLKIPGHTSKDISINALNNEVHIKGYKHDKSSHHRKVQTFHKIIMLPEHIDPKSIHGTVDTRGNLQITGKELGEPWENDDGPLIESIDEHFLYESESPLMPTKHFSKLNREYYDEDLTIEVFEY